MSNFGRSYSSSESHSGRDGFRDQVESFNGLECQDLGQAEDAVVIVRMSIADQKGKGIFAAWLSPLIGEVFIVVT